MERPNRMKPAPLFTLLVVAIVVNGVTTFGVDAVAWATSTVIVEEVPRATSLFQYIFNSLLVGWGMLLAWGKAGVRKPRRLLLLGTDHEAMNLYHAVRERGQRRFEVVGLFGSSKGGEAHELGLPIWDQRDHSLAEVASQERVREVVITHPCAHTALPLDDLVACRMAGVRVVDYHDFHEKMHGRLPVTSLLACHLTFSRGFDKGWWTLRVKRVWELALTLVLFPLCMPLFALIAIAIKLDSRGPVFYRQERLGLNGKNYTVWKFRSMHIDAEADGPQLAVEGDERITRVGGWLRRMRFDELPQLFNVLAGDMSLVGPRPERACFVEALEEQIPFYLHRTAVKPGVTGWAQVNADYAMTLSEHREKLEYDLYYIKNLSFWLDMKILFATVGVVLCGRGR